MPQLDQLTYAEYLATPEWRALADRVKERDGACRICNSPHDLQAHHRRYPERWSEDEEANLTVLCDPCHWRHHHQDGELRRLRGLNGTLGFWRMASFILAFALIFVILRWFIS